MRNLLSACAVGLGVAALILPLKADDKMMKLEGGYTMTSGERDGQPLAEEKIKGNIVRVTGDKIVVTDKDKKEVYVTKYTLDETAKPCKIMMTSTVPSAGEATGLIKKEGDTVTLIYALPGGQPPTEFKTQKNQIMVVLKNMNKDGDK